MAAVETKKLVKTAAFWFLEIPKEVRAQRYIMGRRQKGFYFPSCQKATALAAATFKESTPWDIGIFTV